MTYNSIAARKLRFHTQHLPIVEADNPFTLTGTQWAAYDRLMDAYQEIN